MIRCSIRSGATSAPPSAIQTYRAAGRRTPGTSFTFVQHQCRPDCISLLPFHPLCSSGQCKRRRESMTTAWFHKPPALGTRGRLQSASAMTTAKSEPSPLAGTSSASSSASSSTPASTVTTSIAINKPSLITAPFISNGTENAQDWLDYFQR